MRPTVDNIEQAAREAAQKLRARLAASGPSWDYVALVRQAQASRPALDELETVAELMREHRACARRTEESPPGDAVHLERLRERAALHAVRALQHATALVPNCDGNNETTTRTARVALGEE